MSSGRESGINYQEHCGPTHSVSRTSTLRFHCVCRTNPKPTPDTECSILACTEHTHNPPPAPEHVLFLFSLQRVPKHEKENAMTARLFEPQKRPAIVQTRSDVTLQLTPGSRREFPFPPLQAQR